MFDSWHDCFEGPISQTQTEHTGGIFALSKAYLTQWLHVWQANTSELSSWKRDITDSCDLHFLPNVLEMKQFKKL